MKFAKIADHFSNPFAEHFAEHFKVAARAILCLTLAGCASLGEKYKPYKAADDTKAVIYAYRPSRFQGSAFSWDILIDGHKAGSLASGAYLPIEVPPGTHQIAMQNIEGPTWPFSVKVRPGQSYFLRMDQGIAPLNKPYLNPKYVRSSNPTEKCPYGGIIGWAGNDTTRNVLHSLDERVQIQTCTPGFAFVGPDLAINELRDTRISKSAAPTSSGNGTRIQ